MGAQALRDHCAPSNVRFSLTIAKARMAKVLVLRGSKAKTSGGLSASSLTKNKNGKVVSKKAFANIKGWTAAVQKARKALGVKGFVAVKKGTPLYKKAKEIYGQ